MSYKEWKEHHDRYMKELMAKPAPLIPVDPPPTIRQQYKIAAFQSTLAEPQYMKEFSDNPKRFIENMGVIADAMIEEDKEHGEKLSTKVVDNK